MPQTPAAANGPDSIRSGARLSDRYDVQEAVGYGGMATVYHGRDTLLDRDVAIKVLNQRIAASDSTDRDAFLREARAAASLAHSGIAATYDAGIFADSPYIVMEYVSGRSLKETMDAAAPLPPERAIDIAIQVADALEYGHRRGVVHCDVKPQNILLGHDGQPKIVDFGISQTVAATAALTSTVSGTAGYVAPEQLEGLSLDGRADLYSLGTVLYQMLARVLPFEAPNLTALATRRLVAPPRPIRDANPAVPPDLAAIVMRSLARDREDRFASAGEFADALRDFRGGVTRAQTARVERQQIAPAVEGTQVWQRPTRSVPADVGAFGAGRGLFWFAALLLAALVAGLIVALAIVLPGHTSATTLTVPEVENTRLDDAAKSLQSAGVKIAVTTVDSDQAVGTVLSQQPAAGGTMSSKDYVSLTVSRGHDN